MIARIGWYRREFMTIPNMLFCWHVGLTMMLVWWSFILALPASTFALSPAYSEFARICPDEQFWSLGYGFAALIAAAGAWAAWPGTARHAPRHRAGIRMGAVVLTAFVHGMTAKFMLTGAAAGTGSGIYFLIMCSAYLLLRAEYERS